MVGFSFFEEMYGGGGGRCVCFGWNLCGGIIKSDVFFFGGGDAWVAPFSTDCYSYRV